MALLDAHRIHVDVNGAYLKLLGYRRREVIGRPVYEFVVGGPRLSDGEWQAALAKHRFTGDGELLCADSSTVAVQYAATTEIVTGHRRVLFVALNTSRWGPRFRRAVTAEEEPRPLTAREREIVRLVALGKTGPEIAEELVLAHDTVRTHVRNAMDKIGARSRAQLVARVLAEGQTLG